MSPLNEFLELIMDVGYVLVRVFATHCCVVGFDFRTLALFCSVLSAPTGQDVC